MSAIAARVASLGTENAFRIGEDIAKAKQRGVDVIRLTLGEPDFDTAPHITEAARASLARGDTHYVDPQGILPFRKAAAAHIARTRGIEVSPDDVVALPGAKPAIAYSFLAYVNPGDEVVYPSPGFPIYESWVTFLGAKPVPLVLREEKAFAFEPAELEALLTPRTKLLILCSPSNPTGGVLSPQVLEGVARVIERKAGPDLRIFSDEIYEDLTYDGFRHASIASLPGMRERTVIATGLSKSFAMTGWRMGYAVLPNAAEARLFKQLNINYVSCVAPFVQEAAREALESPKSAGAVAAMREEFRRRRDVVVPALNEIPGVRCNLPLGAFYVFPNVEGVCRSLGVHAFHASLPKDRRAATSPATLFQRFLLYYHGVAVVDRRSFGVLGSEGQDFVRLSIAADLPTLKKGLERFAKAASDADGFRRFTGDAEALGV
ncbi:MAG: pyridoxal phosphate-dependent aminotransferase [Planctomycetes bacterium]|nr:pyridoxal phosphate-dependent aminotransferase [Planctomycetota bacterium]